MTRQIDSGSQPEPPVPATPAQPSARGKASVWVILIAATLSAVLFFVLMVASWPRTFSSSTAVGGGQPSLLNADRGTFSSLKLAGDRRALIYAQPEGITLVPVGGGATRLLSTPGYRYDHAVPPLLTPAGQILYSGAGIWLVDPLVGHPRQIASLPPDRVVTSLVLSQDGTFLAWSSAPRDGKGVVEIYAGPLERTVSVYQSRAEQCPCLRAFAWLVTPGGNAATGGTLLLTSDDGADGAARDGLWQLNLNGGQAIAPRQILAGNPPQGPLAFVPQLDLLLYTQVWGYVPVAQDGSMPGELATERYANDLALARLESTGFQPQSVQTIVPGQQLREVQVTSEAVHYQSTPVTTTYHWLVTPRFSPDDSQLAYVQFTSDNVAPFKRQSALYLVRVQGRDTHLALSPAQLQALAPDGYFELGSWLDTHTITLIANNTIYALDIQQKALARISTVSAYGTIVAAVTLA